MVTRQLGLPLLLASMVAGCRLGGDKESALVSEDARARNMFATVLADQQRTGFPLPVVFVSLSMVSYDLPASAEPLIAMGTGSLTALEGFKRTNDVAVSFLADALLTVAACTNARRGARTLDSRTGVEHITWTIPGPNLDANQALKAPRQ